MTHSGLRLSCFIQKFDFCLSKPQKIEWGSYITLYVSLKWMETRSLVVFILFLLPHRYSGLSAGDTREAPSKNTAFYTFSGGLQAHKAELHLTSRTYNVFTFYWAMLQQWATGGTGPHGGTPSDSRHTLKDDVRTGSQCLQWQVAAAVVSTAVRPRLWTLPFPHALPAEVICSSSLCCAHVAADAQIKCTLSRHRGCTSRTLWGGT